MIVLPSACFLDGEAADVDQSAIAAAALVDDVSMQWWHARALVLMLVGAYGACQHSRTRTPPPSRSSSTSGAAPAAALLHHQQRGCASRRRADGNETIGTHVNLFA